MLRTCTASRKADSPDPTAFPTCLSSTQLLQSRIRAGRAKTILTFGLISKNKGIEVILRAMPEIIKAEPAAIYIVLGMTHPSVLRSEGESYRFSLQKLVRDLDLQNHVIFHNRFVNDEELHNFLCAADIYVTPYLGREQLTSGTLAFAEGTGKAVVSTPEGAAEELLADAGKACPSGSGRVSRGMRVLEGESLYAHCGKGLLTGRDWRVGQLYWGCSRRSAIYPHHRNGS
jgi:glycosyltransferase involved in cell wall biosynthesis